MEPVDIFSPAMALRTHSDPTSDQPQLEPNEIIHVDADARRCPLDVVSKLVGRRTSVCGASGRVGSAFAAELGTMAVSEQTDSLRVLGTDPVDYLVTPRVLSCMIAGPILNVMCFTMGALTCRCCSLPGPLPPPHPPRNTHPSCCAACCVLGWCDSHRGFDGLLDPIAPQWSVRFGGHCMAMVPGRMPSRRLSPAQCHRSVPPCHRLVAPGCPVPQSRRLCSRCSDLLCAGIAASTLLAQAVYDVPANVILGSAAKAVGGWDIATSMIKAWVFGVIISVVRRLPELATAGASVRPAEHWPPADDALCPITGD